jgi:hypothetical protein
MVIDDLDLVSVSLTPCEANAPLIVDADAVLAFAVTFQSLQSVARQRRKGAQIGRGVEHIQFSQRLPLDGPEALYRLPVEEALGVWASKGPHHLSSVYCFAVNVNQYECLKRRDSAG